MYKRQVEDSLLQVYDGQNIGKVKDFLNRKSDLLGFNAMLLIDRNEQFYCTDSVEEEFMNLPGIQSSFQGENSLSFLNEQSIRCV